MSQHRMTHKAIVQGLVDAIRVTLGDIPKGKGAFVAQKVLARQLGTLVAGDHDFVEAIESVVEARVAGLIASPEVREKILDDPNDPDHVYWLLTTTDTMIRLYARKQADHVTPAELFARMGPMAIFGGMLRPEREADDSEEDGNV